LFRKAAFATVVWNEICRLQPMEGILDIRLRTRLQDEKKSHGHLFNSDIFRNIAFVIAWVLMGIGG
jgi:hypothetical protein